MSVIFTFRDHPMSIFAMAQTGQAERDAILKQSYAAMDAAVELEQNTDASWTPAIFVNSHLPSMAAAVADRAAILHASAEQGIAANAHRQSVVSSSRFGRY